RAPPATRGLNIQPPASPAAARAPRAATPPPRRRAWLGIFVVRYSLPCDPSGWGHSCNGERMQRFHRLFRLVDMTERSMMRVAPPACPLGPERAPPPCPCPASRRQAGWRAGPAARATRARTQCGRPPMAASRSSPSSRRARGKSCRSPGGSQPSSLPAHTASRESARTLLWHHTHQAPSPRGGTSLGCSRQLLANDVSFDHLVGAGEHGCRDFDAERLGRLQVDYQLELRRLFYRELAGFSPLQYLIDVNSRTVTDCVRIGSI